MNRLYRRFGALLFRPWFDELALRSVAHWYLPLSRGWAAAVEAEGDLDRFLAELPANRPFGRSLRPALRFVCSRHYDYRSAASAWEAALFSMGAPPQDQVASLEAARHRAAHRHMTTRWALLPVKRHLPPVKWAVPSPEEVERRHAGRLNSSAAAFPPPRTCEVQGSRTMPTSYGRDYWLRYPSPVLGDVAWARVQEPSGTAVQATVVYLHGIGIENDMWAGTANVATPLVEQGLRVVAPEAPWHGRRRTAGHYGGEPIMARGPLGLLDLLQAWVAEVGLWVDWARQAGRGPVVLAGVSLGALTAQMAACAASGWPARFRPDALLLVATTGRLLDVAQQGSLARAIGLPRAMAERGWSERHLERWLPLLQPGPRAPLPPERILMLLGRHDDLTPFEGGRLLSESWKIPAANLFLRDQGHFSASLSLLTDRAPLERLSVLLRAFA